METRLLIDGEQVAGEGPPLAVENPFTEETLATVALPSEEQSTRRSPRRGAPPGRGGACPPSSARRCSTTPRRVCGPRQRRSPGS